ncbi:rifampicin phosphotransferase-like [Lineus longissimus]|uniref:rifampicin phosphotransferase-like n=1 Tax=Lineus longissimus TaxID=88925 RepID=UPI002B4CB957
MILELFLAIPLLYLAFTILKRDPWPLFGVYARKGKWFYLKKFIFYLIYKRRQTQQKTSMGPTQKAGYGYGQRTRPTLDEMEEIQPLVDDPNALDCVYFCGMNQDGVGLVARFGRRVNHTAEIWLVLNVPDVGYFQHPIHPHCILHNTLGGKYEGGGLKIELLEPKRRWKVSYNGLLRKGLCNTWDQNDRNGAEYSHVKFSFIFECYTDIFNFDTDMDARALSDAVARETWSKRFFSQLKEKHQTHYEQFGEMRGSLAIDGQSDKLVTLRGVRDHTYGIRDWHSFHRYAVHYITTELGHAMMVGVISMPGTGMSHMTVGYVFKSSGYPVVTVSEASIDLPSFGENKNPPTEYEFNFTAGGEKYNVTISTRTTSIWYQGDDWNSVILERFCDATVNGQKALCLAELHYRHDGSCPVFLEPNYSLLEEPQLTETDKDKLVVAFKDKACQSSELVGGKGSSLAMLTSLGDEVKVPTGFCVTLTAFKMQLERNPQLQTAVTKLEHIACGKVIGNLKQECELLEQLFTNNDVLEEVQRAVDGELETQFGGRCETVKLAVRSSAAGEDGEEMSAAGQMETILGVVGKTMIYSALSKCWASQFSHQAVEYKRQHGQPITSLMGVVIQEMVPSEISGVLFTRDPLSGNPSVMMINANYGLGESVVSGTAEPDTIYLSRNWDNRLAIKEKTIGGKKVAIKLSADGGTSTEDVDDGASSHCCMSDEKILQLGKLGVTLEKSYGDARDIEWAIHDGEIYLLQARPITSFEIESEYDLIHEFDSPLSCDKEWVTTANIGEMMPGAMTPLSMFVFLKGIQWSIYTNTNYFGQGPSFFNRKNVQDAFIPLKGMATCCNHLFINLYSLFSTCHYHIHGVRRQGLELSLMAKTLEGLDEEEVAKYVGHSPWWKRLKNVAEINRSRYHCKAKTQRWGDLCRTYRIEGANAAELYHDIDNKLPDLYKCWIDTVLNSSKSGVWGAALLFTLTRGKQEWKTEHVSDVAMLLSKCDDVYSADVPTAMKELAEVISKSNKKEAFLTMTCQDAVNWLKSAESGEAGKKFAEFIDRHGHRCVREAEFRETSWRAEPTKLIPSLQMLIKVGHSDQKKSKDQILDVNEAISKLKTPTTWFGRKVLKLLVPWARQAVGGREWGKSISIEFNDIFKEAYWKLAKFMVEEGYLPDRDLLFFLTHYEIGQVLKTRSAKLVARASKRRRVLPKQMDVHFPEISIGHPTSLKEEEDCEEPLATSVTIKGMPVSQGLVKGRARVVKTLKEAETIQFGDILIVPYTDVGWTPYFPLLAGLVTEIGGLLSHGAVVAREYGLPCVVNCPRATHLFKTDDTVILNATKGMIEKIV